MPSGLQRTATPVSGHVQQTSQRYERRKRKRDERNQSALYLPAWSVGLMLLLVFGITGAIVMLVITLGGQSTPGGQPRIVIITAQPSDTPNAQQATATSPGIEALPSFQGLQPTFGLEGPTLAPIVLTPTPITIAIGETVIVNSDSLNIRKDAGLNQTLLTTAVKGDRFKVLDGPKQADNLTWWHIQDTVDPTREGWAAADYLDVAVQ
jgi:hypothetical protein